MAYMERMLSLKKKKRESKVTMLAHFIFVKENRSL